MERRADVGCGPNTVDNAMVGMELVREKDSAGREASDDKVMRGVLELIEAKRPL